MGKLFDMQLVIVLVLLGGAIWYLGRNIYKSAKGHACAEGKCGCTNKNVRTTD